MDKIDVLDEFFKLCNAYNPMHGFGSESGSYAAGELMSHIRHYVLEYPYLKPVDKAFFAYWYKGDDKPKIEDFM